MSHAEERKDKDCLNCGTVVQGRFCHVCGQENIVPHETFGHMIKHFFYDITHFDSKFLDTVKFLVTKPGFLSREYMKGRRVMYLNPVKMYVFTSAIFFLIFYSLYGKVKFNTKDPDSPSNKQISTVQNYLYSESKTSADSTAVKRAFTVIYDSTLTDSITDTKGRIQLGISSDNFDQYATVAEYDSIQKTLPRSERHGWLKKLIGRRTISIRERWGDDDRAFIKELLTKFLHTFPYILFVSLPLYALFLKLLYRKKKNYFFVDHGIFLIHLYIFTFLLMLVYFAFNELDNAYGSWIFGLIMILLVTFGIIYAVRALKNFYEQGWGKTILKFFVLNILCIISLIILFAVFFIITLLTT